MIKLAIIGDPVEHSLSPVIHSAVMEYLGIDYEYYRVQVKKGDLAQFLERVRREDITGFNLTMPHKTDIIPFLDEIDSEAKVYNSVNTVKYENGWLSGYSTDADGYKEALAEAGYSMRGKRVVILGAGGVSGTIVSKAAREGAVSITVLNRTLEKAEQVIKCAEGCSCRADVLSDENMRACAREADVLVNATPLGMTGVAHNFENLDFLAELPKDALVSDLIYSPRKTAFLKRAEELGRNTINGFGMLIYQALIADEIYLGRKLDLHALKAYVEEKCFG